jgi:hypothetical protein
MTFSTLASPGVSLQGGGGSGGGAASAPLTGTGATVTTSQPLIDVSQTWNNAAVTFTSFKLNITDTASNAASLLMDLQVGGASAFNVSKAGSLKLGINSSGTNVAGTNVVVAGSQGTGTGAGGSIIFQVAPAGSSGLAQNALADALTISSTRVVTIAANASSLAQIAMADRGTVLSIYATAFGVQPLLVSASGGIAVDNNTGAFRLGASQDVRLERDTVNTLALRNGTAAQAFNLYGTYTDASNYRRAALAMTTAGVATLKPEGLGTGASGNVLHISGLPTSNPGPGILWNNAGTPAIGT